MTYPETIRYLESFINYEKIPAYPYKESLKLERIRGFLDALGNPEDSLRCIHVAGTKGKGSTSAFLTYILREGGYKTGLYTSPHLSDFRERIRILNPQSLAPVPQPEFEGIILPEDLAGLVKRLKPEIEKYNRRSPYGALSFFEVYTALALTYFKERKVDFAVLETGLGGRLDATNAVNPLVCAITPISYEHTQKLGNTLREIAKEKAGIIKSRIPGSIVISAPQEKEAIEVIRARCKEAGAKLYEINPDNYRRFKIKLLGEHQQINANLAAEIIKALGAYGIKIKREAIKKGLYHTVWPGRCETVSRNPLAVLDGAQNLASSRALKKTIKENFKYRKLILVLGISSDKDIKGICHELSGLADSVILTRADSPRAAKPEVLGGYFKDKERYLTNSVKEAISLAKQKAGTRDLILVTGSLFVVGEAREIFYGFVSVR
ncbi:MAG: folylpolyglutamate synthase/dihydrofolate synthase family protein [Candidatus Omnitrophota bacterium]|jgi:dihydrofolate synthase/folylpolyglutamate synthase